MQVGYFIHSTAEIFEHYLPLIEGVARNQHTSFCPAEQILDDYGGVAVIRLTLGPRHYQLDIVRCR